MSKRASAFRKRVLATLRMQVLGFSCFKALSLACRSPPPVAAIRGRPSSQPRPLWMPRSLLCLSESHRSQGPPSQYPLPVSPSCQRRRRGPRHQQCSVAPLHKIRRRLGNPAAAGLQRGGRGMHAVVATPQRDPIARPLRLRLRACATVTAQNNTTCIGTCSVTQKGLARCWPDLLEICDDPRPLRRRK